MNAVDRKVADILIRHLQEQHPGVRFTARPATTEEARTPGMTVTATPAGLRHLPTPQEGGHAQAA